MLGALELGDDSTDLSGGDRAVVERRRGDLARPSERRRDRLGDERELIRRERTEGVDAAALRRVVGSQFAQAIEVRYGIFHRGEVEIEKLALASQQISAPRRLHLVQRVPRHSDFVEHVAGATDR